MEILLGMMLWFLVGLSAILIVAKVEGGRLTPDEVFFGTVFGLMTFVSTIVCFLVLAISYFVSKHNKTIIDFRNKD